MLALLAAAMAACATSPAPPSSIAGVNRVAVPSGCYEHVTQRDWNVQLDAWLEASLLSQLSEQAPAPRCWHETRTRQLLLVIGDDCGPHREAIFQQVAGKWTLLEAREVPVVLCNARK